MKLCSLSSVLIPGLWGYEIVTGIVQSLRRPKAHSDYEEKDDKHTPSSLHNSLRSQYKRFQECMVEVRLWSKGQSLTSMYTVNSYCHLHMHYTLYHVH